MNNTITEEQMDLVVEVYNNHYEEYKEWMKDEGKPYVKEWLDTHSKKYGIITQKFAYFICTKFMDWRNSKVGS